MLERKSHYKVHINIKFIKTKKRSRSSKNRLLNEKKVIFRNDAKVVLGILISIPSSCNSRRTLRISLIPEIITKHSDICASVVLVIICIFFTLHLLHLMFELVLMKKIVKLIMFRLLNIALRKHNFPDVYVRSCLFINTGIRD